MALPSILEEIDRLFDELIHRRWGPASRQVVPTEIREVADGWLIELSIEGLRAADLRVEVHGRTLTISGQRRREQARSEGPSAWSRAQQNIALHRTITLPGEARPNDIEAKVQGANLSIHVRRRTS
ncbi:MAG: Hsp20/alpha crystallin family protein [Deltaproteobacteria bacterium]|nr:Hsp20/alpha crystallin family protein [Deltaproteobacteria bacterium]MBI3389320.1 Hsp20/alpha crystallin family protein [Deltaproteobacteria bacterium]